MTKHNKKRKGLLFLCLAAFLGAGILGCGQKAQETYARQDAASEQDAGGQDTADERKLPEGENAVPAQEAEEDGREGPEKDTAEEAEAKREERSRPKVKGIFVTGPTAGTERMKDLMELVERSELNAIVMDVKNDEGRIVYDMQVPIVQELGADIGYVRDMQALIQECKEKDIYLIARLVAFKDPFLAEVKPEWCIHNADGSIFRDKGGLAWLNPYEKEVWEYLLAIAKEALTVGFDEIQFDYVRFSTDNGMEHVDLGGESQGRDRGQIITEFVQYISEEIHKAQGAVSADVYGMVIDSEVDQRIVGQSYVELAKYLDYISPMIYPSHYGPYNYNIPVPDAEPYRLVLTALQASKKVLAGVPLGTVSGNGTEECGMEELAALSPMEGIRAGVRPWLQDFTATWVKGHIPYGPEEIRAQIQAVYDAGYEEWILWNASNRYTEDGLLTAGEAQGQQEKAAD